MMYRCLHGQVNHLHGYLADHLIPAFYKSLLVFVCAPPTDTSSSFLAVHSVPIRQSGFFDCWPGDLEPDELIDPARSFDSFRQFLKTILFSIY